MGMQIKITGRGVCISGYSCNLHKTKSFNIKQQSLENLEQLNPCATTRESIHCNERAHMLQLRPNAA